MNILAFKDIENYLSNRQVWNEVEIVNSDLKTIIPARTVVNFEHVYGECLGPDRYSLNYTVNGEKRQYVYYGSISSFFGFIENQFIPV